MCKSDTKEPAARDGRVTGQLSGRTFQVSVPSIGPVVAQDRTGRASRGSVVTVVQVQGGAWRIV
ncbi:hypothetical protein [Deinococcus sp. Leaf326]|uniref:hypothetical protein n=1 Tax=Deinococcus sp. Leaf326 TaxID=1736338 RepID=UPI0006FE48DC|nr:hypothetical protein [Deinococcus sp. Leaf326]KQR37722.1 hypothetical protein ASF71_14675 [Deinococcus sp. Leaf326]